jgi:2-phosphosulfolactate phosphatase
MDKTVEVCFTPVLYPYKLTKPTFNAVVVDILRATTSICAALDFGVEAVIPVGSVEDAQKLKAEGYLVACERNGQVSDFADLGNSASEFCRPELKSKTIAFSTTNGTQAVRMAAEDARRVFIGSFVNLEALFDELQTRGENVVILCAGWKNLFNLEDSLFAGALTELLLKKGNYSTACDAAHASLDLWLKAKDDLAGYLAKSSHRNRLRHLVSDSDFSYTIHLNTSEVVPVYHQQKLVNIHKS